METLQTIILVISMLGGGVSLLIGVATHRKLALLISAAFLILVGVITIIGYMAGAPAVYTFPANQTSMAMPTGICFLITGLCLLGIINEMEFKLKNKK